MALSNALDQGGNPPERLEISAVCTFDIDNVKVSSVDLDIRAQVPGIDEDGFQDAVGEAEQGCPVSNALRGNVEIRVNASLERSEEHTSELQSRQYLVCRLLLEKK